MGEYFANVNGIEICYELHGKENNFPLICVHGFGSTKETYMAQVSILSEKFKIITFDNRGAGKSDRPDGPYSMDLYSDDLKFLMDYLKIKRAHLLGFSMGGMILQNFVLKYPEKVNKIVLINTNAGIPQKNAIDMFKKSQLEKLNLTKKDPEKAFWQSAHLGFYIKFRKQMEADPKKKFYDLWSAEDLINYIQKNPPTPQDIENMAHAVKTHDTYDKLNQIHHRTLLLAASHDKLVPKSVMFQMHQKMPNSVFKVIDKAGHESLKEKAPEVNYTIINFLEEN